MKINIKICLLFVLAFLGTTSTFAQKKKAPNFEEGTIRYKVELSEDLKSNPQIEQVVSTLAIDFLFKGNQSKLDVSLMGGMASFQMISNFQNQLYTVLMNVPSVYDKVALELDPNSELMKKMKEEQEEKNAALDVEIKYNKRKKKKIAKYKCYAAEMEVPNMPGGGKITFYVTDKIRTAIMPTDLPQALMKNQLKGFPLGFELEFGGKKVNVYATSVDKKSIEVSSFEVPSEYTKQSFEEFSEDLKEKMGNVNGGGAIGL